MREFHVERVCEMYRRVSTERASGAGVSFGCKALSEVDNRALDELLTFSDERWLGAGEISNSI
jgi:hypothetical protein